MLFILFTSNPFSRTLPNFPIEGRDLNPLLQDPGLIFHPPLLYMGYVGFSVAFAFAIASLLSRRLDSTYARFTRPWTLAAWIFLTLGIVLGSAWAYYELGWGGWWFWDPVENASFMPWLVGTALMHSLAVTEQRASFKAWTLLLAISAFSLCLLGTFLVRSGVLVSVHAFASDPARGMFILAFMVLVIGGSLLLFCRAWTQSSLTRKQCAVVAGIFAVSEQRFAGRRDAGGVAGDVAAAGAQATGTGQYFDWRTVLQHHVYLADGAVCATAWCRPSGALGTRSPT